MRARVVFVGRGLPKDGGAGRWGAMSVREFAAGRARPLSPVVVVLGDRALAETTPVEVCRAVAGTRTVILAAPEQAPVEIIAWWARAVAAEFVSDRKLRDRIRELESRPLRVRLEPGDWLPAPPSSPSAAALVDALTSLDAPRVSAWAKRVGVSRHRLRRLTRRHFSADPATLSRRYVAACVAAERRHGRTLASIADSLGYADAPTLRRAVRRAQ